jgi:hypothetical protein
LVLLLLLLLFLQAVVYEEPMHAASYCSASCGITAYMHLIHKLLAVPLLQAFQRMQEQKCNADAILYNTLLDVLWDTGVAWAQHKAGQLFRQAVEEGHFRLLPQPPAPQQQATAAAAAAAGSESQGAAAVAAAPSSKPEPGSPSAASAASGGSPTAAGSGGAGAAAAAATASKLELGLQGVSPGVAMLMLHCWFADLRYKL